KAPYEVLRIKYRKGNHILEHYNSLLKIKLTKFNGFFESYEVSDINIRDLDALIKSIEELVEKLPQVNKIQLALIKTAANIQSRVNMIIPLAVIENSLTLQSDGVLSVFSSLYQHYLACELLEQGCILCARSYISKNQLDILIDIELQLYTRMFEIEKDLRNGRVESCVKWCLEQKTHFKKSSSVFFLKVRIYEFSHLIKSGQTSEAFQYAVKHFSAPLPKGQKLVEDVLCLLAYNDQSSHAFSQFFTSGSLDNLIHEFLTEYKIINGLNDGYSDFSCIIQYGLMALRTRFLKCDIIRSCDNVNDFNVNCPSCNDLFREIASALPYPCRSSSIVRCRLTKKFYGNEDHLFTTHDGHVYSSEVFIYMAYQCRSNILSTPFSALKQAGAIVMTNYSEYTLLLE
ncbi:hypothetical protein MXB_7, partial [Myxobolus squamalis]